MFRRFYILNVFIVVILLTAGIRVNGDISFSAPPPPEPEGLNWHLEFPLAFSVLIAGMMLSAAVGSAAVIVAKRKQTEISRKWIVVLVVFLLATIFAAVYASSIQSEWTNEAKTRTVSSYCSEPALHGPAVFNEYSVNAWQRV